MRVGPLFLAICLLGCDVSADLRSDMDAEARDVGAPRNLDATAPRMAEPDAGSGSWDGGDASDATITDEEVATPSFDHFDLLVDTVRSGVPTWASFTLVSRDEAGLPMFADVDYADTGDRVDFWPASVIKIYTATAALQLLAELDMSIDAAATFYHQSGGDWIEDTTVTFRKMIVDIFDHSSNSDYTLLLRFCGIDWLNSEFFTEQYGFRNTALMVGYVDDRTHRYAPREAQRIVVREDGREVTREHEWSGLSYSTEAGCTIGNGDGLANCSSTREMVEHMRRIMFHEYLDPDERFDIREEDMNWYRFGSPGEDVLRTREHGYATPIYRWLPNAEYYHKAGAVSSYRLDLQFVRDPVHGIEYIAAFATETGTTTTGQDLSEAFARLAIHPWSFVRMGNLEDHVNPVQAQVTVHSDFPATLALVVMDRELPFDIEGAWETLPGTETTLVAGSNTVSLTSDCLSADGAYHILAKLDLGASYGANFSDYHYVIVDADDPCP